MSTSDTPDASVPTDATTPLSFGSAPVDAHSDLSDSAVLPSAEPEAASAAEFAAGETAILEAAQPDALTVALTPPPFEPAAASTPAGPADLTAVAAGGSGATAAEASVPRPRTRWAGIVWGLVLAAIAAIALSILTDSARLDAAIEWLLTVTPAAAIAYAVLVIGAFALIAGIVGLARRAQRGLERRREASVS